MPRVIGIVPSVAERSSGPTYSTLSLTQNLIEAGMQAELAVMKYPTDPEVSFLRRFPIGWGPKRLGNCPAMLRYLRQQARSHRGEIVLHNHGMWMMNSLYPAWISHQTGVPLVTSPRGAFSDWAMTSGSSFKKPFWSLLQRDAVAKTACFHATAEHEITDIRRLGFKQPIALIQNGIDIPDLCPLRKSPSKTILYLGRLHEGKGVDILLQAWSQIQSRYPDWRIVIAGSDVKHSQSSGYESFLLNIVRELRLNNVDFVGDIQGQRKQGLLSSADIYVLPSISENFGISIAEALSSATPVITTKGTPWHGLVTNNAGWWINTGVDPIGVSAD